MKRAEAKTVVRKLFESFGKSSPPVTQIETYLDWAEQYDVNVVTSTVEKLINGCKKFPVIAEMHEVARNERANYMEYNYKHCWYCGDIGLIPALYRPNEHSTLPFTRYLACRCTRGDLMAKHTPRYFERFNDCLQFQDRIKGDETIDYPNLFNGWRQEIIINHRKERSDDNDS
jgi:hypothetical protein|tara:strand:+ start:208 stop:726 length:519 start_codon:yes stop_codon:yes gene_type:complete